jgi:hypothetical protein
MTVTAQSKVNECSTRMNHSQDRMPQLDRLRAQYESRLASVRACEARVDKAARQQMGR